MLEEARALIKLGLPIIPICPPNHKYMSQKHIERCRCPGKMPIIKDWTTKTTTTEEELRSWQTQFREFNIGLPLGEASGYCGIDVDGDAGIRLLMQMSNGDLPNTWEFATAAGSRLLYRIPDGIKTKKFKQTGPGAHEECALLCTGQQTVMPPSVHQSGAVYQWVQNHSPWDLECAQAPQWLINAIKQEDSTPLRKTATTPFNFAEEFDVGETEFNDSEMDFELPTDVVIPQRKGKTKHPVTVTEELLTQRIPEGQRDNTMTTIVGHYCASRDLRRLGKEMILNICLKHNQDYCDPPLDDQAIMDKVNFFFDSEQVKDANFAAGKSNKPVFEATQAAKNVIQYLRNQGLLLQFDQFSHMYYYTMESEGPWQCTHDVNIINSWIRTVITSTHYGDASWDKRSYVEETRAVLEEMFTVPFKKNSDFDLGAHSAELCKYIVVKNGMLDWREMKIYPWNPDFHTTLSFKVDYEADADCPRFKEYMSQWLPDEHVRCVVQEYLGYCLIPNTNFRKALFLYGKGRNGKSIFIEFLQDFFKGLSATLSYDALFQRFGPANLKDKLINIHDDTNISFSKDTGIAKNLIAGGTISAEFKGKDQFTFTNVARVIYSAQEMPRTADTSLAWYERWFFIKFPNEFRTSNTKKAEMITAMQEERSGIFNWMLEGLVRLTKQDGFTSSSQVDEYTKEYRGINDSVIQFLNAYCTVCEEVEAKDRITTQQMYNIYSMFAENDRLRAVSKKVFHQRVEDAGFNVERGVVGRAKGQTFFKHLALNYASDEVQQNILYIRTILTQMN